jgi:hypothetical protein
MNYDDWKLDNADDEADRRRRRDGGPNYGECDACGEYRALRQAWVCGTETWACAKCSGDEEYAYDEPPERNPDDERDEQLEREADARAHPEWNED